MQIQADIKAGPGGGRPVRELTEGAMQTKIIQTTLLDLVQEVQKHAHSDDEVVAIATLLINTGRVQLTGNFAGQRIDPI